MNRTEKNKSESERVEKKGRKEIDAMQMQMQCNPLNDRAGEEGGKKERGSECFKRNITNANDSLI